MCSRKRQSFRPLLTLSSWGSFHERPPAYPRTINLALLRRETVADEVGSVAEVERGKYSKHSVVTRGGRETWRLHGFSVTLDAKLPKPESVGPVPYLSLCLCFCLFVC